MKKYCIGCHEIMVEKIEDGRFLWECPWCGRRQKGLSKEILDSLKPKSEVDGWI